MSEMIMELVHELGLMSIDELEEFRADLVKELQENNFPEIAIDFCGYIVDRVIVAKAGGAAV